MDTTEKTTLEKVKKGAIRIIGISTRTINAPEKAEIDIPALWGRFMEEGIAGQIPSKVSDEIYCVYCEYEGDHLAPYTTLIGFPVASDAKIPEGMQVIEIAPSDYVVFEAQGDLTGEAITTAWHTI